MKVRMILRALGAMLIVPTLMVLAYAGGTDEVDYTFSLTEVDTFPGGEVTLTASLDNDGEDMSGAQGGVCQDSDDVIQDEGAVEEMAVADFDVTFKALNYFDGDGWNFGILMNVVTGAVIAPGDYDLYEASYRLSADIEPGEEGTTYTLEWCTLGTPEVPTAAIVAGVAITPDLIDGIINVGATPAAFAYTLVPPDPVINYDPADGSGSAVITIEVEELEDVLDTFPSDTQGFQCALRHDDLLVTPTALDPAGEIADLEDSFFGVNLEPGNGPGATVGVVYSLTGGVFIQFDGATGVVDITYETVASALDDGSEDETLTDLTWANDLGTPVLPNEVVVGGFSYPAETTDATLTLNPQFEVLFIRGDCNTDGEDDLADAIWMLEELFRNGLPGVCQEACDANDDGGYDQSDAIFSLNHIFLEGPSPPAPFPECGTTGEFPLPDCAENPVCD